MKRREFFRKAGVGSAMIASLPAVRAAKNQKGAQGQDQDRESDHEHGHEEMNGPLVSADVSFGEWNLDTPLDRFPNDSNRLRNNHQLIPSTVEIKAGGSVNFHVAGFHHILIYGDGIKPADINRGNLITPTMQPAPPLINDPVGRIYRGLDPSVLPILPGPTPQPLQDRIETVRFPNPGKFLVICGVLPHFFDPATNQFIMYGYVRVRR
jgi:hypothetical protein